MKKIFLLCLILVLFVISVGHINNAYAVAAACSTSGGGAGACYVDNTCTYNGNGTASTCAASAGAAGAYNSITNMIGYTQTGDDVIYIKAGLTYAEKLQPPSDGSSGHPITFTRYGTGVNPIITGGTAPLYLNKNYIKIKDITFTSKQSSATASTATLDNVVFKEITGANNAFQASTSGTITMNNCTVINAGGSGVQANSGTTIIMRNCQVFGNAYFSSGYYGVHANSGTIDYDYCLITGNGLLPSSNVKNTTGTLTDGGHNHVQVVPYITQWQKGVVGRFNLHLSIDDGNTTDALDTASYFASNLTTPPPVTMDVVVYPALAKVSDLVSLQDTYGWEITNHSYSHFYQNNTYPFTVTTTTNTDNPLFIVDTTAKTVSLTHTAGTNNVSVGYTNTNGYNDTGTIQDLVNACSGKGWTITMGTFNYATAAISRQQKLKVLAATAGTAVPTSGTTCQALVDSTALIAAEITDSKAWFTDQVANGLDAPTVYQYPNGSQNDTIRTAVKDAGYIGSMSNMTGGASYNLSSFDVYRHQYVDAPTAHGDGADATIDAWAIHDYVRTMSVGGVSSASYHGQSQITNAELTRYISKMQSLGVTFENSGTILSDIRSSHSTSDNMVYTKTYTDVLDLTPKLNSPLIGRGVAVTGLTTDIKGNNIITGFETIGGVQYQPRPIMF